MSGIRILFASGIFGVLAIVVGCGRKDDSDTGGSRSTDASASPSIPSISELVGDSGEKDEAKKRMRQVGLAIHNYESSLGTLPGGIVGPKGELGLSWRVQILPYLGKEEAKLYEQFKLTEAWDSDHNKRLLASMPRAFKSPGKAAPEGKTHLQSFAGETAFLQTPHRRPVPKGKTPAPTFPNFPPGFAVRGRVFAGIIDGTSNTLIAAEASEPVEWTSPVDMPFPGYVTGPTPPPVPKLGGIFQGGFHGLMGDGAVHFFPTSLSEKTLRAMISTDGGEILDREVSEILFPPKASKLAPPQTNPDGPIKGGSIKEASKKR